MSEKSAFGSTARKVLVWAIAAVVAIFVFKVLIGIVMGIFQLALTIGLVLLIGYAVIWAIRKL
jgi:hypothetical protein